MNAEHFKELIDTVCMTTHLTQKKVAAILGVTNVMVSYWKRNGIPKPRSVRVCRKLAMLLRTIPNG